MINYKVLKNMCYKKCYENIWGPILRSAQMTFYTDACIVASLHPAQPGATTLCLERHVGEKQRRFMAQRYLVLF